MSEAILLSRLVHVISAAVGGALALGAVANAAGGLRATRDAAVAPLQIPPQWEKCAHNTCKHDAICFQDGAAEFCICAEGYGGKQCERLVDSIKLFDASIRPETLLLLCKLATLLLALATLAAVVGWICCVMKHLNARRLYLANRKLAYENRALNEQNRQNASRRARLAIALRRVGRLCDAEFRAAVADDDNADGGGAHGGVASAVNRAQIVHELAHIQADLAANLSGRGNGAILKGGTIVSATAADNDDDAIGGGVKSAPKRVDFPPNGQLAPLNYTPLAALPARPAAPRRLRAKSAQSSADATPPAANGDLARAARGGASPRDHWSCAQSANSQRETRPNAAANDARQSASADASSSPDCAEMRRQRFRIAEAAASARLAQRSGAADAAAAFGALDSGESRALLK